MDKQTDEQTKLRWLKRATAVAAVVYKNFSVSFELGFLMDKKLNSTSGNYQMVST